MTFQYHLHDEPFLEFGDSGFHIDPRLGLATYGPLQQILGDRIRIGVVGTAQTVEGIERWLERIKNPIDGASSLQPNLRPPFPGLGNNNPFRCGFEIAEGGKRILPNKDIHKIVAIDKHADAVEAAVELFVGEARALLEGSSKPDVIIHALPFDLIQRVVNDTSDDDDDDGSAPTNVVDFRDLLKARSLTLRAPSQIVWPSLYDENVRIPRKVRKTMRTVQDPATKAWNLLTALFYKAGRAPWRLPRLDEQLDTTFIGIGFYRDRSGQRLLTSTAQMFDERGKGLIIRGDRANTDKGDRHPYLDRTSAYDLVRRSLNAYRSQHYNLPARVVVFKTSRFEPTEAEGFQEALSEEDISFTDLVWVSETSPLMLLREGGYPPLRGSLIGFENKGLLYTRGSTPYYRTYPGLRTPRPLLLSPYNADLSMTEISRDVLALTKMNWNSTQFDGAIPIPIRAARQVGKVLRYVPFGQAEASQYQDYM